MSASFAEPPDPGTARTPEDLVAQLRLLRGWAGIPSYARIAQRVNDGWRAAGLPARDWTTARATVADCFTVRPRGPADDLLLAIVAVLNPDPEYVARWRQAIRVVRGNAAASSLVTVAARLPDEVAGFAGRAAELRVLADRRVTVLEGMPGVGKTSLALRAGHDLVRAGYRVLFADLRGYHPDPAQPPADPGAVLAEFLRLLGVPGDQIPRDADPAVALARRAARYRELTRDLRLLVVLDNAASAGQVRELIPDGPDCRALVTSRRTLPGLPAMPVEVLTEDDALDLIRAAAGPRYDRDLAALLARALGYLPLALAVLATQLRSRDWPLADQVERLLGRLGLPADPLERTAALRVDTPVSLALDLSYGALPADRQRLLRLLALHPGQDAEPYAAAALAGFGLPAATAALRDLAAANLLRSTGPGRWAMHDLIRAYAIERARDEDAGSLRRAAQERLFDHYRYVAARAVELAGPRDGAIRLDLDVPVTPVPSFAGAPEAAAWLAAEHANLIAAGLHAAEHGWLEYTSDLSTTLSMYLISGAYWYEAEALHRAAARTGDPVRLRRALNGLAFVAVNLSRYTEAEEALRRALELARSEGNRLDEGRTHSNLGSLYGMTGRYEAAAGQLRAALAVNREAGDVHTEGRTLGNLGILSRRLGRYEEALRYHGAALDIFAATGNRRDEAIALTGLARVRIVLGQPAAALDLLERALEIAIAGGDRNMANDVRIAAARANRLLGRLTTAQDLLRFTLPIVREIGDQEGEAGAANELGLVERARGRTGEALRHQRSALATAERCGDRPAYAEFLNDLGETLLLAGAPADALAEHERALERNGELGARYEVARAHAGIAAASDALGDTDSARTHGAAAVEIIAALGVPVPAALAGYRSHPAGGGSG